MGCYLSPHYLSGYEGVRITPLNWILQNMEIFIIYGNYSLKTEGVLFIYLFIYLSFIYYGCL